MSDKTIQAQYGDREVKIETQIGFTNDVKLTITETKGAPARRTFAFLTPENAYEIHDWIAENVERPKPKSTADQIRELPVGTVFNLGVATSQRVKTSETHYWAPGSQVFFKISDYESATLAVTEVKGP